MLGRWLSGGWAVAVAVAGACLEEMESKYCMYRGDEGSGFEAREMRERCINGCQLDSVNTPDCRECRDCPGLRAPPLRKNYQRYYV